MSKKMKIDVILFTVYDGIALTDSLYNAHVLLATDDKEEAKEWADDYCGVVYADFCIDTEDEKGNPVVEAIASHRICISESLIQAVYEHLDNPSQVNIDIVVIPDSVYDDPSTADQGLVQPTRE